jgi:hypothetical protein
LNQAIARATGAAQERFGERLLATYDDIAVRQGRLDALDGEERALHELTADARWVAEALGRFDEVWDVMTAENRRRLLHSLVKAVIYDEAAGTLSTELTLGHEGLAVSA